MASFDGSDYGLGTTYTVKFDTQAKALKDLIGDLKNAGVGAAGIEAAIKAFIKQLSHLDSSGKSVNAIKKEFNSLTTVISESGERVKKFMDVLTEAHGAQLKIAAGATWNPKFDNDGNYIGEKLEGEGNTNENNIASRADALAELAKRQEELDNKDKDASASRLQRIGRLTTYIIALTRAMMAFVDKTAKANRELFLLASHAQSAVNDIAAMGGVLEAYGGTKGQAADRKRQYEIEMAKMKRGQGTGGNYMEASRLYGVEFIPNDYEAQRRAHIQYMSRKDVSDIDKIGFAALMGYDAHEVLMMKQGVAAYDKEIALQRSLHENAEAAAEASNRYMIASQHLEAQIEDIKNGAMIPILNILTPIKEFMAKHPALAGAVGIGAGAIKFGGEALKTIALFRLAFGGGGDLLGNIFGGGGGGVGGGGVGGGGTSAAGSLAGAVGSISGSVVGLMSEQVLIDIRGLLGSWFTIWCVMNGATQKRSDANKVIEAALQDLPTFATGIRGAKTQALFANNMAYENYYRQVENRESLMMFNRARQESGNENNAASQVTIEQISISVSSDSANPDEVAKAVREQLVNEMRYVIIGQEPGGRA